MSDLSKVTIGIKTLLRDSKLFVALDGIRRTMPEVKIIVADDGIMTEEKDGIYAELIRDGHQVILCDFDAGFGYKSNRIAGALKTEYLLVGSDDFDFSPTKVREGIEKLLEVLEHNEELSIVSGRVNHRPYEFDLIDEGNTVIEVPKNYFADELLWYAEVDLTVNYSLIRNDTFEYVGWDDGPGAPKIGGGEHGSFYVDCKRTGLKVAWVPNVNIKEQAGEDSIEYRSLRNRARLKNRPCFAKRGIERYILGNGTVDYDQATCGR
jgi:hypothetical protein